MELTAKYKSREDYKVAWLRLSKLSLHKITDYDCFSVEPTLTITVPSKGKARFLRRHKATLSVLGFLKPDVVEAIQ